MKTVLILTMLIFAACDDNIYYETTDAPNLEGLYYFNYGASLEVLASDRNCLYVLQNNNSLLSSVNPENNTLGTHPKFPFTEICTNDGIYRYSRNQQYSSGNDLEQDISGSNITGNKKTDFEFSFQDGQMKLKIKIYSNASNNNINSVIAEREFESL